MVMEQHYLPNDSKDLLSNSVFPLLRLLIYLKTIWFSQSKLLSIQTKDEQITGWIKKAAGCNLMTLRLTNNKEKCFCSS